MKRFSIPFVPRLFRIATIVTSVVMLVSFSAPAFAQQIPENEIYRLDVSATGFRQSFLNLLARVEQEQTVTLRQAAAVRQVTLAGSPPVDAINMINPTTPRDAVFLIVLNGVETRSGTIPNLGIVVRRRDLYLQGYIPNIDTTNAANNTYYAYRNDDGTVIGNVPRYAAPANNRVLGINYAYPSDSAQNPDAENFSINRSAIITALATASTTPTSFTRIDSTQIAVALAESLRFSIWRENLFTIMEDPGATPEGRFSRSEVFRDWATPTFRKWSKNSAELVELDTQPNIDNTARARIISLILQLSIVKIPKRWGPGN
jgi:hypothetical protein